MRPTRCQLRYCRLRRSNAACAWRVVLVARHRVERQVKRVRVPPPGGTRTGVARVRAEYPNQLDYSGVVFFVAGCCGRGWQVVAGVLWVGFARVRGRCAIATGVLWPLRGAR